MLDDTNFIRQKDPDNALGVAAEQYLQLVQDLNLQNADHDNRPIYKIVLAGMGGSALSAMLLKACLKSEISQTFEIIRGYNLPKYVDANTLVIASSYSGNTEETISCLSQARQLGAQVAVVASGGKLAEIAQEDDIATCFLKPGLQPRMVTLAGVMALLLIFKNFGLVDQAFIEEVRGLHGWLGTETEQWLTDTPTEKNLAKQIALQSAGKTAVFYGGELTAPLAYKWKISWNENAKNLSFWNQYPEFNHNEFMGWTSHPVERPFVVFDLISQFEHSQILKRFEVSDRLLSGKRPKSNFLNLAGESLIAQLLWGCILADFSSIYLALLNGVNPTPVDLIEKLKVELSKL